MRPNRPIDHAYLSGDSSHLCMETLESRRLLTVTTTSTSSLADDPDYIAAATEYGGDLSAEFLTLLEAQIALLEEAVTETTSEGIDDPLPVVPYDGSIDPAFECPDVEGEYCLPGDIDLDGSVDFEDFLDFSANFGLQDATWEDGDFDGDGLVGFNDFLLISSYFGV